MFESATYTYHAGTFNVHGQDVVYGNTSLIDYDVFDIGGNTTFSVHSPRKRHPCRPTALGRRLRHDSTLLQCSPVTETHPVPSLPVPSGRCWRCVFPG